MTTVVAFAFGEACVMAGDTMTNVYDRPVPGIEKVALCTAKDGGNYLLGFAGEGAGPWLVRRDLNVDELPDLADEASRNGWACAVAQAITELYLEHQLVEGGRMDANLLLGVGGYLWTITHMQAIPHLDGIGAIGSGEGPAIGALHAFLDQGLTAMEAVTKACRVGIEMDRYSGGKPTVASVGDLTPSRPDSITFV